MSLKTGNEDFFFRGNPQDFRLLDYWRWSTSDLLNNTIRGTLAEFICARALGINRDIPRVTNEEYDLAFNYNDKWWILEIKTSGYIQSWTHVYKGEQREPKPRFTIAPTRKYDSSVGRVEKRERSADLYIFCLHKEKDCANANPLILDQWEFYPVPTSIINEMHGNQKTASLTSVKKLCPDGPYDFQTLRDAVLRLFVEPIYIINTQT